jgi:hypothetical protein
MTAHIAARRRRDGGPAVESAAAGDRPSRFSLLFLPTLIATPDKESAWHPCGCQAV